MCAMCTITIATNKIKSVRAENAIAKNVSEKKTTNKKNWLYDFISLSQEQSEVADCLCQFLMFAVFLHFSSFFTWFVVEAPFTTVL